MKRVDLISDLVSPWSVSQLRLVFSRGSEKRAAPKNGPPGPRRILSELSTGQDPRIAMISCTSSGSSTQARRKISAPDGRLDVPQLVPLLLPFLFWLGGQAHTKVDREKLVPVYSNLSGGPSLRCFLRGKIRKLRLKRKGTRDQCSSWVL